MAVKNFGAAFWLANASGTLTKIGSVTSVKAPSLTRGTIDTTDHDTPDGVMTFIGEGVADPGDGSVTINWVPGSAGDTLVLEALASGGNRDFKIVANGAAGKYELAGECIVTGYEPDDQPVTGKQTATISFKASGALAWDEAA
jgi:hypothetical protein